VNILFCGDVVGRAGREAVKRHVPPLREMHAVDLVVVNAENAAGGFGLTERLCGELYDCGVDILTTGNHVWDQRQIIPYMDRDPRLLRPANFPTGTPGAGWRVHQVAGRSVLVINLMGRLFMDALDDPFARLDEILGEYRLGTTIAAILVDFHAEASSEKMALGHFADGRVSAVFGTHCHVPTADAQILPVKEGFGRADILVNSAGFTRMVPHHDLEALDDELIDAVLTANVRGPFATIRAFVPLLRATGDAVIVNISSGAAQNGTGSSIIYGASKAALNTMSMALARVLGPEIRVIIVAPGMVHTGFVPGRTEEMMAQAALATPLKRAIEAHDVALAVMAAITHLTHTTGSIISVDAGRHL
jgi:2',3'-cyclic-nucleotide 2'-phosphodiesterase